VVSVWFTRLPHHDPSTGRVTAQDQNPEPYQAYEREEHAWQRPFKKRPTRTGPGLEAELQEPPHSWCRAAPEPETTPEEPDRSKVFLSD